jgi:hypothetical protein
MHADRKRKQCLALCLGVLVRYLSLSGTEFFMSGVSASQVTGPQQGLKRGAGIPSDVPNARRCVVHFNPRGGLV